jgi:hypothetical protein
MILISIYCFVNIFKFSGGAPAFVVHGIASRQFRGFGFELPLRKGFRGRNSARYNPYLSESDRLRAHCSGKPTGFA